MIGEGAYQKEASMKKIDRLWPRGRNLALALGDLAQVVS